MLYECFLTPVLFIVFGLPFGTSDSSKCFNSSINWKQNDLEKTGNE